MSECAHTTGQTQFGNLIRCDCCGDVVRIAAHREPRPNRHQRVLSNYWRWMAFTFAVFWAGIYLAGLIAGKESRHWAFTWFLMNMIWWRAETTTGTKKKKLVGELEAALLDAEEKSEWAGNEDDYQTWEDAGKDIGALTRSIEIIKHRASPK